MVLGGKLTLIRLMPTVAAGDRGKDAEAAESWNRSGLTCCQTSLDGPGLLPNFSLGQEV